MEDKANRVVNDPRIEARLQRISTILNIDSGKVTINQLKDALRECIGIAIALDVDLNKLREKYGPDNR